MNAMILAAGRGQRLRPFTDCCPKPLLEVRGKALIEYHLAALQQAGIEQVVINISWLAEQIPLALGDGSRFGLHIQYSSEPQALETAGGIVQALPLLDEQFIVVNGDILTDYAFMSLTDIKTDAHLVLVDNPAHNPAGDFSLTDNKIGNQSNQRLTFAGIAVYQKRFFKNVNAGKQALAPLLRRAADQGHVSGEHFQGRWTDVGTVERWQAVRRVCR